MQQTAEARGEQTVKEMLAGRMFTPEDRVELMAAALNLCEECKVKMRAIAQGRDMARHMREQIWKWFGHWGHGSGCPDKT